MRRISRYADKLIIERKHELFWAARSSGLGGPPDVVAIVVDQILQPTDQDSR